ncbi:hypothetical protein J2Y48_001333 [Mycoplana sp. BE70]|uniref:hypothetical protein n=1 Tax=Mycoplana sp. BE70 TaxID=2817775 RepID=UPI00285F3901|nr:hypothetical protein [Mycoplana sp. BE70]MDR6756043.1 hypothetical protein [Mycoplana sp. BE70]
MIELWPQYLVLLTLWQDDGKSVTSLEAIVHALQKSVDGDTEVGGCRGAAQELSKSQITTIGDLFGTRL